jgi:hypothetical protein
VSQLRRKLSGNRAVVELDSITLTAPLGWKTNRQARSSSLPSSTLPRAEGDDSDGRLTVSTAGGTVTANIDRWKSQFQPEPKDAK